MGMAQPLTTFAGAALRPAVSPAEVFFAGLDGRYLRVRGQAWQIEVYGICEDAGRRWVQVAIDGPQHYMITLAMAARTGVAQAVGAVTRWLEEPSDTPQMLHVV